MKNMKQLLCYSLVLSLFVLASCKDDDGENLIDFSVSFSSETVSLSEEDTDKEITLSFSRAATETSTITLDYTVENATYGTDFTTNPAGDSGSLTLPVTAGDVSATFTLTKLEDPIEGTTKSVTFSLASFGESSWVQGSTTSTLVSFTPIASNGGTMDVEQGGATEPNQVYVDLSTGEQTVVKRDTWELGFYNGTENYVYLNSSLSVSAAELTEFTDLNEVNSSTVFAEPMELYTLSMTTFQSTPVTVNNVEELLEGLPLGYTQYGNTEEGISFTDSKEGDLSGTAFGQISTTATDNHVFLVSLGKEIPTENPEPGSIATTGDPRGILKVRILTDGNVYTIQYAELDATTFNEATITKEASKILTAFSFESEETVDVEPASDKWDLNFTGVYSYYGPFAGTTAGVTFSDYVLHNTLGNVGLYQVITYEENDGVRTDFDVPSYSNFTLADVDEASLNYSDKTVIASDWRNSSTGVAKDERYYIVKDASDNFYKIRFTAMLSNEGERGYPQFTYEKL